MVVLVRYGQGVDLIFVWWWVITVCLWLDRRSSTADSDSVQNRSRRNVLHSRRQISKPPISGIVSVAFVWLSYAKRYIWHTYGHRHKHNKTVGVWLWCPKWVYWFVMGANTISYNGGALERPLDKTPSHAGIINFNVLNTERKTDYEERLSEIWSILDIPYQAKINFMRKYRFVSLFVRWWCDVIVWS